MIKKDQSNGGSTGRYRNNASAAPLFFALLLVGAGAAGLLDPFTGLYRLPFIGQGNESLLNLLYTFMVVGGIHLFCRWGYNSFGWRKADICRTLLMISVPIFLCTAIYGCLGNSTVTSLETIVLSVSGLLFISTFKLWE